MSDRRGKVLSFGPFELSIGNRRLTNGARIVPLGLQSKCSSRRVLWRDKQEESGVTVGHTADRRA
jgi:hypothetical protein